MWSPILVATAISGCLGSQAHDAIPAAYLIVGGVVVSIDKVPYQLVLVDDNDSICGASVIDDQWALTAAHCVWRGQPEQFQLRSGSNKTETGGILHQVTKLAIHDKFHNDNPDYDVAVLQVDVPFIKKSIIDLATGRPAPGKMATVSGWGRIQEGGPQSKYLRSVQVPIVEQGKCAKLYSGITSVTSRMLCAGFLDGGKDACEGDSGGPLVIDNELVGIVSYGYGCARKEPGIYTDVAEFRNWIEKQTGQNEGDQEARLEIGDKIS